ncbi:hypothetical protein HY085_01440 [Candidatus Gottesmanbacteria bacterium]|nr:hypothetical protein [Candidatus Gottesmanbacteria bacterium]
MGERDIIALLVALFEKYKISYILTGSFAGSFWGRPRATHDIDFVVEIKSPEKTKVLSLLKELGHEFDIDPSQVERAIDRRGQFNIFYPENLLKIDFWVAKDNEFEKNKFKRKISVDLFGQKIAIVSAEDLILTKLSWCKEIYSDRHFRDCVGILEMQKGKLDEKYLSENTKKLGITKFLAVARKGKYY